MNFFYTDKKRNVHDESFPENFRMLIVGQSGAGKTVLLMRLLLTPGLLNYDKLHIFARSLHQPEYQCVTEGFKNKLHKSDILNMLNVGNLITENESSIEELALGLRLDNDEQGTSPSTIEAEFYNSPDMIPDPADLDKSVRNLMVFDDIMTDKKQTTAENYYTRGRSCNCDSIYLSQNYTHLPLHTIRSNANFMIFFKSSPVVVEQLHRNFASVDMAIYQFKELCKKCWSEKYGYIVIDLSRDYDSGLKYRNSLYVNYPDEHFNK